MAKTREERIKALLGMDGMHQANVVNYNVCPTRIPELNALLPGGFVRGKVNMLFGSPSSGKSTTAVETIADEQKRDKDHVCLLIPAERGEDLPYYRNLGLDMNRTIIMKKPQYILEDVMQFIEEVLEQELVDSVLVDSWDGLIGYKELYTPDGKRKEATRDTVAAKAAGGSKTWKRIKGYIADRDVLFLVICQVRTKGLGSYIVTEGFAGGHALEHNLDLAAHMNLAKLHREKIDGKDVVTGQVIRIKIAKSKVNGNVHQQAEVIYKFGNSWDQVEGLWNVAVNSGLIIKTGGWYEYPGFPANKSGARKIQGEVSAKDFFQDENVRSKLQEAIDYMDANPQSSLDDICRNVTFIEADIESTE
jgi:recombination protein RecA